MADVNIQVDTFPTQISVTTPGIQGPAGATQDVSQFLTSGEIDNFVLTTGEADARYLSINASYISGLSITGSSPITGLVNFTGIGGLELILLNNTI